MNQTISLADDFELVSRYLSSITGFATIQDVNAKFLAANQASMLAMGFEKFALMSGRYPGDMKSKFAEIQEQLVAHNRFIVTQKTVVTSIFSAIISNGNWGLFLTQQEPLYNQSNEIIGVSSHSINITDTPLANKLAPNFLNHQNKKNIHLNQGLFRYTSSYDKWAFSKRQSECFFWLLHKKSAVEIGQILGLTKRTVESYIRHIKAKFQVSTVNELIELAASQGLQHYIPEHWICL